MHVVLLTQEPAFWCRTNCWIKLFLFSLCTKLLLIAPYNYRWTTCHMDFFFLICFCLLFRLGQCSEWQEAMCGGSGKVHEPGIQTRDARSTTAIYITWTILTMSLYLSGSWTWLLRCCLCRVRKLWDFIKNIFICFPKMNEGFMGLERHEGEIFMTEFFWGVNNPFKYTEQVIL